MKGSRYVVVEKECCGTCIHYHQHYVLYETGKFIPIWYGHCATPRLKRREPDEVCPYWASVEPSENFPCHPEEQCGEGS